MTESEAVRQDGFFIYRIGNNHAQRFACNRMALANA
jgi:hypothetical protein